MFMPRNIQKSETQYIMARKTGFIVVIPGRSGQLQQNKKMAVKFIWIVTLLNAILPVAEFLIVGVFDDAAAWE